MRISFVLATISVVSTLIHECSCPEGDYKCYELPCHSHCKHKHPLDCHSDADCRKHYGKTYFCDEEYHVCGHHADDRVGCDCDNDCKHSEVCNEHNICVKRECECDCSENHRCKHGKCIDDSLPTLGCDSDSGCGEGAVCNDHHICIECHECENSSQCPNGFCEGGCCAASSGHGCDSDSGCGEGEVCNDHHICVECHHCEFSFDCPSRFCEGGCCAESRRLRCNSDSGCGEGAVCNDHHICVECRRCNSSDDCHIHEKCERGCCDVPFKRGCDNDSGCGEGEVCNDHHICVECTRCTNNRDCSDCSGSSCIFGCCSECVSAEESTE
jgi:hypothetical protein